MTKRKRLFLIDGSALFYRSFFAFIRNPLINSKGENTSAIFGFVSSLMKILTDEKPDYIGVVFDTKEPTFRHKKYEAYKATRQKMPEEMADQYPRIVEFVKAFNIPVVEMPGYEADDVIATLARQAEARNIETMMVTGDKDFMQLLTPLIKMYVVRPGKEVEILDPEYLKENMNLTPPQVIDYLALMGDSSDNIPGVTGVGDKTARSLLNQFNSLDELYERLDEVKKPALHKKLAEARDQAYLSRELATIITDVPVQLEFDQLKIGPPDTRRLLELCDLVEFRMLSERIAEFTHQSISESADITSVEHKYQLVRSSGDLNQLVDKLKRSKSFVFDTETTGLDVFDADIIGLSFAVEPREAWYVPLNDASAEFTPQEVMEKLRPIFESDTISKAGQNIKYDGLMLWQHGIRLRGVQFDTMVAHYLLNPGTRQHNLDFLAQVFLNYKMVSIEELIGPRGKNQKNMSEVPVEKVAPYACEDADITLRLKQVLEKQLEESGTLDLFHTVEMPLLAVLMEMEKNGVKLDLDFLSEMSASLGTDLDRLQKEIYEQAGREFNINSPQQLGKILFDELEIHKGGGKRRPARTPTGQYSTSEQVLERYADHPLVARILEFRRLAKLKSTYVDALPQLVSERTGRLHTSFNQTVAATGRLSSSDPNLQNIPIRTEIGREIRKSFIAENPDDFILSADYSQIELRIMAHLSDDPALREAFAHGEDIHKTTAAAIFNIPPEMVSPDHRRKAKEVNFGIIYGISHYGLANRLGIDAEEARQIIDSYFARFPLVNKYMTETIKFAYENKYVTTILNRRRNIPEIDSRNTNIRQNAERIAINTTIQGSAADLIKLAMINIQRWLEEEKRATRMILQVHDELVFEVPAKELERIKEMVRKQMEEAMRLSVPLKVDLGVGKNWLEAH